MNGWIAPALTACVGAFIPFRPFLGNGLTILRWRASIVFYRPAMSPGYVAWRLASPMSGTTRIALFIAAIVINALLYGLFAHLISRRVSAYIDGS